MATLTALATAPPDSPRRAGPLRPVLIGLLRKNPRHRMRAAEVERLLQRIVDGNARGMAGRKAGRAAVSTAGPDELSDGSGTAGVTPSVAEGSAATGPPHLRTVTEETFRHTATGRWRRGAFIVGAIAVAAALVAPVVVLMLRRPAPLIPQAGTLTTASANPIVLSEQMGVQACAAQQPANETAIPPPAPAEAARHGLLANWAYHEDPTGFHLIVPATWGLSRIGSLVCFRDSTSAKTVAVDALGEIAGDPTMLLARGQAPWRSAADLKDYELLGINDRHYTEGAADLEYTYTRGTIRMHGVNRMLRMGGKLYTISFLTTDVSWPIDRAVMDVVQPSFGLDP